MHVLVGGVDHIIRTHVIVDGFASSTHVCTPSAALTTVRFRVAVNRESVTKSYTQITWN